MKYFKLFWVFLFLYSINVFATIGPFSNEVHYLGTCTQNYNIVGDFNGDRISDIAYINSTGSLTIKFSSYNNVFTDQSFPLSGTTIVASNLFAGDFNGDGYDDLATYYGGDFYISLIGLNTNGTFSFRTFTNWTRFIGTINTSKYLVGDFNGDGIEEILYYISVDDNWTLLKRNSQNSFSQQTDWADGNGTALNIWAGDFNGDGLTDKLRYNNQGQWKVALATATCLSPEGTTNWSSESIGDYVIIGDFNGDSRDDVAIHYIRTGNIHEWRVMTANETASGFVGSSTWAWGQGTNNGVYAGDFDGDGICDKISYVISNSDSWKGWWLATTQNNNTREVGVTFLANGCWNSSTLTRDRLKYPYIGSTTSSPQTMYYFELTPAIFNKQVDDMNWCGFDFIMIDATNGFTTTNPNPNISYSGSTVPWDGLQTNNVDTIFTTMQGRPATSQLKIGVMLGLEFWGKGIFGCYSWTFTNWNDQKTRQQRAVNSLKTKFSNTLYYRHLGKPLLEAFIGDDYCYPMSTTNLFSVNPEEYLPKSSFTDSVTLRYLKSPSFSYTKDWGIDGDPDFPRRTLKGMKEQGMWGWGSGPLWTSETVSLPTDFLSIDSLVPPSKELMSITPGIKYYNKDPDLLESFRGNNSSFMKQGSYYKKSWCDVLTVMPQKVIIYSWNAYVEESAIENTVGTNGWGNLYLNLTRDYIYMFKNNSMPEDRVIYFKTVDADYVVSSSFYSHPASSNRTCSKVTRTLTSSQIDNAILIPNSWLAHNNYVGYLSKANDAELSFDYDLSQNYPNPFNPETEIKFQIPQNGRVSLKVYDILGREVAVLINDYREMGKYSVSFNASKYASGVYFYRIEVNDFVSTKKMMLLK